MKKKTAKIKEAEAFVRRVLARVSDGPVDDAAVKSAAKKVARATPPYSRKDEERAAA